MKIKSKFKDYYDGVFYSGQGDLFLREQKEIAAHNIPASIMDIDKYISGFVYRHNAKYKFDYYHYKHDPKHIHQYNLILFCGELYIYFNYDQSYDIKISPKEKTLICTFAEFKELAAADNYKRNFFYSDPESVNENDVEKIHLEANSPIVLLSYGCGEYSYHTNVKLMDYHFGRIYNSDQAHQRIEMFICNFLFKKDSAEVPVGDDKTRIISAGFDFKTSFRKEKKVNKK